MNSNTISKTINFVLENWKPIAIGTGLTTYLYSCNKFYNIPIINKAINSATFGKFDNYKFNPIGLAVTTMIGYGIFKDDILSVPKTLVNSISPKSSDIFSNLPTKAYEILDNNFSQFIKYLPEAAFSTASIVAPIAIHSSLTYLSSGSILKHLDNFPNLSIKSQISISAAIAIPSTIILESLMSSRTNLITCATATIATKYILGSSTFYDVVEHQIVTRSKNLLTSFNKTIFKFLLEHFSLNVYPYFKIIKSFFYSSSDIKVNFVIIVTHFGISHLIDKAVGENHQYVGKLLGAASFAVSSFTIDKAPELISKALELLGKAPELPDYEFKD